MHAFQPKPPSERVPSSELLARRRQSAKLPHLMLRDIPPAHSVIDEEDEDILPPSNDSTDGTANRTYAEAASGTATSTAEDKGKARAIETEAVDSPPSSATGSGRDFVDTPRELTPSSDDSNDDAPGGFMQDARKAPSTRRGESWGDAILRPIDDAEDDGPTLPVVFYGVDRHRARHQHEARAAPAEMSIDNGALDRYREEDALARQQLDEELDGLNLNFPPANELALAGDSPSSSDEAGSEGDSDKCGGDSADDEEAAEDAQEGPEEEPRRRKVRLSQDKRRRRARRREAEERARLEAEAAGFTVQVIAQGLPASAPAQLTTFAAANATHHRGTTQIQPVLRLGQPQPPSFQQAGPSRSASLPVHLYHGLYPPQVVPSHHGAPAGTTGPYWTGPLVPFFLPPQHPVGSFPFPLPPSSFAQIAAGLDGFHGSHQPSGSHQALPLIPSAAIQANQPRHNANHGAQGGNNGNRRRNRNRNNQASSRQAQRAGSDSNNAAANNAANAASSSQRAPSPSSSSSSLTIRYNQHNQNVHLNSGGADPGQHQHQHQAPASFNSTHAPSHPLPPAPAYRQPQHQHQRITVLAAPRQPAQQPSSSTSAATANGQAQAGEGASNWSRPQRQQQAGTPRQRNGNTDSSSPTIDTAAPSYVPYIPVIFAQPHASYPAAYQPPDAAPFPSEVFQPHAPQPQASRAPMHQQAPSPPPADASTSAWPTNPADVTVSIAPATPGASDGIWGCSLYDFCTFCNP